MLRLLYGREVTDDMTSSGALNKLEIFFQEKSNLLVEVEDLQRSVSLYYHTYHTIIIMNIITLFLAYFGRCSPF